MKKTLFLILLIIPLLVIITGCGKDNSKYLNSISFNKLNTLIENKETFILEIVQDGCSFCSEFAPRFKSVLSEYKVHAKVLNVSNLSEKEYKEFENIFGSVKTPTVIFMEDGIEKTKINRLVGAASKKEIIRKLKQNGYINE